MNKWENGRVIPMTAEDIAQRLVSRVLALADTREDRRAAFRDAARQGIKAILGTNKDGEELITYQQNLASQAIQLLRREQKGIATASQVRQLDSLDANRTEIKAWRDAENTASALLDASGINVNDSTAVRLAEIDAVTPKWPS